MTPQKTTGEKRIAPRKTKHGKPSKEPYHMKAISLLLILLFAIQATTFPQAPQGFNYQLIARDADGNLISGQNLGFRLSILEEGIAGNPVYAETHTVATNAYGQAVLVVGSGIPVFGSFNQIDWGSQPHYIKTELDATGGNNWQVMGTTQLLSVPYAIYANTSGNSTNSAYTAGVGIHITADGIISNTATDQIITLEGESGIQITGVYPEFFVANTAPNATHTGDAVGNEALVVVKIQGRDVASTVPDDRNILRWNQALSHWEPSAENQTFSTIQDSDGDTKIEVEKTPDDDIIHFELNGVEKWVMKDSRLEACNTGFSLFIGEEAGKNDDLSYRANVFLGSFSGSSNISGALNTAIGFRSLYANTTGNANTATGHSALSENITGVSNSGFGHWALNKNTSGSYNTAVGSTALSNNLTGSSNTAVGYQALNNNTTGYSNIATGFMALKFNTSGYSNVANGWSTMYGNTTGHDNTALGAIALYSNTEGSNNVAIGRAALWGNTTGNHNIVIGNYSGNTITTGSENILIGNNIQAPVGTQSKQMILGDADVLYGNLNSKYIGFGTQAPTQKVEVKNGNLLLSNTSEAGELMFGEPSSGGTNYTSFKAQIQSSNITYTLPANPGSNGQVLSTNAEGILAWTSPATGNVSGTGSSGKIAYWDGPASIKQHMHLAWDEANGWMGVGAANPAQKLEIRNGNLLLSNEGVSGEIRLAEPAASGNNYTAFKAQGQSENIIYTLPALAGSNGQILTTDNAGFLSWTSTPGIQISTLNDGDNDTKIQTEKNPNENIIRFDLAGTERWTMADARLEPVNSGRSVFIGLEAGINDNLDNRENVFVGYFAGRNNISGLFNTGIGSRALGNINSDYNTAIGAFSLSYSTGGTNTAIGYSSLRDNTTGTGNISTGFQTLITNSSGNNNVAYGNQALRSNLTGSSNVALGTGSGYSNSNGNGNVFLGNWAGFSETGSNRLYIANSNTSYPLLYGEFDNGLLKVNGKLAISEEGSNPVYQTVFSGGDQTEDITYVLPPAMGSPGQVLTSGNNGNLNWTTPSAGNVTGVGLYGKLAFWEGQSSSTSNITSNSLLCWDNTNYRLGIGVVFASQRLEVGDGNLLLSNTGTPCELRFAEPSTAGNHFTAFRAQSQEANITYTLPSSMGTTGQVLTTDATGLLSWSVPGPGTEIRDSDGNTKVMTEKNINENVIRFDVDGTEKLKINTTGLVLLPTINNSTGVVYKNENSFIHDFKPSANEGYNTFIGENSGNFTMSGSNPENASYNTATGAYSLSSITNGEKNTAIGSFSLNANTTGYYNTGTGSQSLQANTSGYFNTANGAYSLKSNITGNNNTAGGGYSLRDNTIGSMNSAFGAQALAFNTSGSSNTAIGAYALYYNKANSRSTAIGTNAMCNADNRLVGRDTYNTAVGYEALKGGVVISGNTGQYNTAIGDQTLWVVSSGNRNTALGYRAGSALLTGSNNLLLGFQAGQNLSSGSNNIIIGYDLNAPVATGSNQLVIGASDMLYGDLLNKRLGIGTSAPTQKTEIYNGNLLLSNSANAGEIRLAEPAAAGNNYSALKAQSQTANITYTLPAAAGANGDVLTTNATATLSWAPVPAGKEIRDTDGNTKVMVEKNPNEDIIRFDVGGTEKMKIDASGLVLPQTTNNSTGVIFKNGIPFIHNFMPATNSGQNTFVGENAGNFTMGGEFPDQGSFNTAIGFESLKILTTGFDNTAIGHKSLTANQGACYNTAIGAKALSTNTSGNSNSALGSYALQNNSSGAFNTATGASSMLLNTTGQHNTAGGSATLSYNTSGSYNIAIGSRAMVFSTTGSSTVAIGYNAMEENRGNSRSTAIGFQAMQKADNRSSGRDTYNTAIGYEALKGGATPSENTGQYNTAIGDGSLTGLTSGSNNTALGAGTGNTLTTGSNNLLLGFQAGDNITSGSNNIVIGHDLNAPSATGSNQMIIGSADLLYGDLSNKRLGIGTSAPAFRLHVESAASAPLAMFRNTHATADAYIAIQKGSDGNTKRWELLVTDADGRFSIYDKNANTSRMNILSDGKTGIGLSGPTSRLGINSSDGEDALRVQVNNATRLLVHNNGGISVGANTTPQQTLHVAGTMRLTQLVSGSGNAVYRNSSGDFVESSSDIRLKTDLQPLRNSLDKLTRINGYSYLWINDNVDKRDIGLVAQEVEAEFPELVYQNESDGYYALKYDKLTAILVESVKELKILLDEARQENTEMSRKISVLEQRLEKLEQNQ